jgi:microcompartment protein CcmK/EutM
MFIGKVLGALVSTQKEPEVANAKLMVVEALSAPASGKGELARHG